MYQRRAGRGASGRASRGASGGHQAPCPPAPCAGRGKSRSCRAQPVTLPPTPAPCSDMRELSAGQHLASGCAPHPARAPLPPRPGAAPVRAGAGRAGPGAGHDLAGGTPDPIDPVTGMPAELRHIQPYRALKRYTCPGCNQDIEAGTGHVVVIPQEAPDLRRHWHRACWQRRSARRPGRSGASAGKGRGGPRRGPPATRR